MKKLLIHSLVLVLAASAGLAVGFALRTKKRAAAPVPASEAAVAATDSLPQPRSARLPRKAPIFRANDDSPLATKLENDLSMSTGVTRWLYWLEAIEKAAPSDFPRLARLAQGNPTATKLLAARWVEIAPRHFFDTLVASAKDAGNFPVNELASVLFDEWPKRDPDAAIAALSETNGFRTSSWRMTVAGALVERNVERGLRLMCEWHIDSYSPRMTGVAKWAAADPRHAAEFALANPAGYASQLVVETVAKAWAKADPAQAMTFASSKPGELGVLLANNVLKDWAGRNLNAAADWLAGADPGTRNRLSPALVEGWAKQDSAGALAWCESNLTGSRLSQAVGGVLKGAAQSDVGAAATLVAGMNPSPARAEAAVSVAQRWFPDSFSTPTPPEAIQWLAGLDADSTKRAIESVYWRWAESDPTSLAAFLATADSDRIPAHIYSSFAHSLARQNPAEALAWATRLPAEHGLTAGGEAFAEWRRSQPDSAQKWLNDLPASDPRRAPFSMQKVR